MNTSCELVKQSLKEIAVLDISDTIHVIVDYRVGIYTFSVNKCDVTEHVVAPLCCSAQRTE